MFTNYCIGIFMSFEEFEKENKTEKIIIIQLCEESWNIEFWVNIKHLAIENIEKRLENISIEIFVVFFRLFKPGFTFEIDQNHHKLHFIIGSSYFRVFVQKKIENNSFVVQNKVQTEKRTNRSSNNKIWKKKYIS